MKLYSYKSQYPKAIPFRIKLSNGMTRTDPSTFTLEEIADAGYVEIPLKLAVTVGQVLEWDATNVGWKVRDKTPQELESELAVQWSLVRQQRDMLIASVAWRYERYYRHERLGIAQLDNLNTLDQYIQDLADLPQTQTDPFKIVWPSLTQEIDNASIL